MPLQGKYFFSYQQELQNVTNGHGNFLEFFCGQCVRITKRMDVCLIQELLAISLYVKSFAGFRKACLHLFGDKSIPFRIVRITQLLQAGLDRSCFTN